MRIPLLLALLAGFLSSCASTGGTERLLGTRYALVDLVLEEERLGNLGILPTFDPPIPGAQSLPPYAIGTLAVNEQRQVVCTVTAHDPVMGVNGSVSSFNHDLVRFTGHLHDEEPFARAVGANVNALRLGVPSHLRFRWQEEDLVEVRAFTGDKELPYVYYFRLLERPRQIAVPYHVP